MDLEEAKALVGFIPSDPQFYPPFLESMDKHIEKKCVEWVKKHKIMLRYGWEQIETLLPYENEPSAIGDAVNSERMAKRMWMYGGPTD